MAVMDQEANCITKENFAELACERISRVLCFPGDDEIHKWSMRFLQKAARGFRRGGHEPWLNTMNTVECSKVILSTYKSGAPNSDLDIRTLDSALPNLVKSSIQLDVFLGEIVTHFLRQLRELHEEFNLSDDSVYALFPEQNISSKVGKCKDKLDGTSLAFDGPPSEDQEEALSRTCEDIPLKRRKEASDLPSGRIVGIINFLRTVWTWAREGNVKLTPVLVADILISLPDCIEEVILTIASGVLKCRGNETNTSKTNFRSKAAVEEIITSQKDHNSDFHHIKNILQESHVFLEAVAASSKLFQMSTSVLTQLLILSSGCSCQWSSMLSLSTVFASMTAKGRAEFYPLPVQPLVLLMAVDPNVFVTSGQKNRIIKQFTMMCGSHSPEIILSLLSHFPEWLTYLDPILYLCKA